MVRVVRVIPDGNVDLRRQQFVPVDIGENVLFSPNRMRRGFLDLGGEGAAAASTSVGYQLDDGVGPRMGLILGQGQAFAGPQSDQQVGFFEAQAELNPAAFAGRPHAERGSGGAGGGDPAAPGGTSSSGRPPSGQSGQSSARSALVGGFLRASGSNGHVDHIHITLLYHQRNVLQRHRRQRHLVPLEDLVGF